MACNTNSLSVLAYNNGHTQWHYRTVDDFTTVLKAGYFEPADSMVRSGDSLIANLGGNANIMGFFMRHEDGSIYLARV